MFECSELEKYQPHEFFTTKIYQIYGTLQVKPLGFEATCHGVIDTYSVIKMHYCPMELSYF